MRTGECRTEPHVATKRGQPPKLSEQRWSWTIAGNETGCLLLHGFAGSPLEMTPIAEALAEEGWTVSVAQLAGHGTSPRDVAQVTWQDWVDSARDAYDELQRQCRTVAVIGLSMGGAVGLYLAASARPAAVVAISTPSRIRPVLAGASRVASKILPFFPVVRWGLRDPQMRRYRSPYTRIPLRATEEVDRLLEETRRVLPELRAPLLLIQGRRDWVIPRDSGRELLRLASAAPAQLVWLPRSGHVATLDRDRDLLFTEVRQFLHTHLSPGGKEA